MRRIVTLGVVLCGMAGTIGSAKAEIAVSEGFTATTFSVGTGVFGLALDTTGAYGNDLYAAINGAVLRVDPVTGSFTTFATGLATGGSAPSGLAFDPGTFSTGLLHVVQNGGSVASISSTGSVTLLSAGASLFSSNDLAFPMSHNPFGNDLYVSNGPFGAGNVSVVQTSGSNNTFAQTADFNEVPIGIAFAPSAASAFGDGLFASVADGTVVQLDPAGNVTPFASGLGLAIDLAISPGGGFGDFMYVTDPQTQSVLRVAPDGTVEPFATGLGLTSSGFDADVIISADGHTMFIANNGEIVRISVIPEPSTAILVVGLGVAMIHRGRRLRL